MLQSLRSCTRRFALLLAAVVAAGCASSPGTTAARAEPVRVKVFVAAMFEIGQNTGDRAGEFQHWYERYWKGSATPMPPRGARLSLAPART